MERNIKGMKARASESCSVIIINWNGKEHLEDCIPSVLKASWPVPFEIIIVDNGSIDGSVEYIKTLGKKNKNIRIIENSENLGFAESNNQGFSIANGSYILFLNNDTLVTKDFVGSLLERLQKDPSIAAVQPRICMYPHTKKIDSAGSYFLPGGFLYHVGHNKKDMEKYRKPGVIFTMKGACMMFRRNVLDELGVFDPGYFAYFEETDLCQRVWISGRSIWYEPDSVIYHKGGETSTRFPSSYIQYHSYKNRIYTYCKNFELSTLLRVMPRHLGMCLGIAALYIATAKPSIGIGILKAIGWNVMNIPRILSDRKKVQNIRKVPDSTYLPAVTRSVSFRYFYHLFATSLAGYNDEESL